MTVNVSPFASSPVAETRFVAALHHDLSTLRSRRGEHHRDRTRELAGWAYLVAEDITWGEETNLTFGSSAHPSTLTGGAATIIVDAESATVIVAGQTLLTAQLADLPRDWVSAAFDRGCVILLSTAPTPDLVSVATNLDTLAADNRSRAARADIRLAGTTRARPLSEFAVMLAASNKDTDVAPSEIVRVAASFPAAGLYPGGVRTLRDLHAIGLVTTEDLNVEMSGVFTGPDGTIHTDGDCLRIGEDGRKYGSQTLNAVVARPCPGCGFTADTDLLGDIDYKVTRQLGDRVAALTAVVTASTGNDLADMALQFARAKEWASKARYTSGTNSKLWAAATAATLFTRADSAWRGTVPAELVLRALIFAGNADARNAFAAALDQVLHGSGQPFADLVAAGTDPVDAATRLLANQLPETLDRVQNALRQALAMVDALAQTAGSKLVWVIVRASVAPTAASTLLAMMHWGSAADSAGERHLMAMPERFADMLVLGGNGEVENTGLAIVRGDSYLLARAIADSIPNYSSSRTGEVLSGARVERRILDSDSIVGWREFSAAEAPATSTVRAGSEMRVSFPDAVRKLRSLKTQVLAATAAAGLVLAAVALALYLWQPYAALAFIVLSALIITVSTVRGLNSGKSLARRDGVHPISARTQPVLYELINDVAASFGTEAPPAWVIEDRSVNAFAFPLGLTRRGFMLHTGWLKHATVAQTRGVIAHELAHVVNRDAGRGAILNGLLFPLRLITSSKKEERSSWERPDPTAQMIKWAVVVLTAPYTLTMIGLQMASSRAAESRADLVAAQALGGPGDIIECMRLLLRSAEADRRGSSREAADESRSTHPATERRLARLQELTGRQASWVIGQTAL